MSQNLFNLLFEISNENRYKIIKLIKQEPKRITDIINQLELTSPEARRHVSRLCEIGLIQRDINGQYHLTPYEEVSLLHVHEFDFIAKNQEYFKIKDKKVRGMLYSYFNTVLAADANISNKNKEKWAYTKVENKKSAVKKILHAKLVLTYAEESNYNFNFSYKKFKKWLTSNSGEDKKSK